MKIQNISTPVVLKYYCKDNYINNFQEFIKSSLCECESSSNKIFLVNEYDGNIVDIIRLLQDKCSKITKGNMYKYEYELEIPEIKDGKSFVIQTTDNKFYKIELLSYKIKNCMLLMEFEII